MYHISFTCIFKKSHHDHHHYNSQNRYKSAASYCLPDQSRMQKFYIRHDHTDQKRG